MQGNAPKVGDGIPVAGHDDGIVVAHDDGGLVEGGDAAVVAEEADGDEGGTECRKQMGFASS